MTQLIASCLRTGLPALLFAIAIWVAPAQSEDGVRVIVNEALAVSGISHSQLRSIFAMRARQFADGTPITVFVLPDQDERHRLFTKKGLNLLPYVLRDTWDRNVFTGTGKAPIEVSDQNEMIRRVSATHGGIGYIVGDGKVGNENIKILQID